MYDIVYKTKTGSSAKYANLLAKECGARVYELSEAIKKLDKGTSIIYVGSIRADNILALEKAEKYFDLKIICAVGMALTGENVDKIRLVNKIKDNIPLFTLQGDFYFDKLKGLDLLMMKLVKNSLVSQIKVKKDPSLGDKDMLELLEHGGSRVNADNLKDVIKEINKWKNYLYYCLSLY